MKLHGHPFKVSARSRALEVSASGDDDGFTPPLSLHAQKDAWLSQRLTAHVEANRRVYGTRRLQAGLADEGKQVSRRRIGRLMAYHDLSVNTRCTLKPRRTPAMLRQRHPMCRSVKSTGISLIRCTSAISRLSGRQPVGDTSRSSAIGSHEPWSAGP